MSPVADAKALHAAIRANEFAPAYYLYGEDDYLKDEALKSIVATAVDRATRDFNYDVLRGADVAPEALGSTLGTPPMMSDRRVVVIRDVNTLKKDARATLDGLLGSPPSDLLLLLVAAAGAKKDARLAEKTMAIAFEPLAGNRIPKWITHYVEHDLHGTITPGAVTLLQETAGTDLGQLRVELDKLMSFSGAVINEAAVSAVVGVRPGETMGDFLDAVARRDAARALSMLPVVQQLPKASAVTTVMALTAQTLALGWAQAARQRGAHPARLSGDLFNLLKESGSVFTGRSWGEFVATCVRASDVWSNETIDGALEALLDADARLKDTRVSSDEQLLATLVLALCGVAPRRYAA